MWDGLHFLLTGVSAGDPIEGDPLSEAVVGVHVFDADDFAGCTEVDEIADVLAVLEAFPVETALESADFAAFTRAGLYPNIWSDDRAVLEGELLSACRELVEFHRAALGAGCHIVVSIV